MRPGANLAAIRQAGLLNDREWEAEHLARERRQKALEDARDEREAEKELNYNMDNADERGNGQYMFVSPNDLQQHAAPSTFRDLQIHLDDLTQIDQYDDEFCFTENMEEMLSHIDALEEEQRNETIPQIMAALPKVKKPTRKSTRMGAGKRKVHFGDNNNDR